MPKTITWHADLYKSEAPCSDHLTARKIFHTQPVTPVPDLTLARPWLAAIICGNQPVRPPGAASSAELVAAAQQEGVMALVNEQLSQAQKDKGHPACTTAQEELCNAFALAAREEVFVSMVQEVETRRLLVLMADAGIAGLLLKGSALAYWAYPAPHLRACSDVDLLLPSRKAAEELARRLCAEGAGYERSNTSGELVAYELMCHRQISDALKLEVDIHWRLANSPLFSDAFTFDELMAESIALPKLGPDARGLGLVHACIHACVHRALNLSIGVDDKLKWLYDLEVLSSLFTQEDWQRMVDLSIRKCLAGVVLHALEAAATTFGRQLPEDVSKALKSAEKAEPLDAQSLSDWRYMQLKTFQSLPTLALRLRWLWQRVFPSRDYLASLYESQHQSYAMLMVERFRRAIRRIST